jgi:hypothetical protein
MIDTDEAIRRALRGYPLDYWTVPWSMHSTIFRPGIAWWTLAERAIMDGRCWWLN